MTTYQDCTLSTDQLSSPLDSLTLKNVTLTGSKKIEVDKLYLDNVKFPKGTGGGELVNMESYGYYGTLENSVVFPFIAKEIHAPEFTFTEWVFDMQSLRVLVCKDIICWGETDEYRVDLDDNDREDYARWPLEELTVNKVNHRIIGQLPELKKLVIRGKIDLKILSGFEKLTHLSCVFTKVLPRLPKSLMSLTFWSDNVGKKSKKVTIDLNYHENLKELVIIDDIGVDYIYFNPESKFDCVKVPGIIELIDLNVTRIVKF